MFLKLFISIEFDNDAVYQAPEHLSSDVSSSDNTDENKQQKSITSHDIAEQIPVDRNSQEDATTDNIQSDPMHHIYNEDEVETAKTEAAELSCKR